MNRITRHTRTLEIGNFGYIRVKYNERTKVTLRDLMPFPDFVLLQLEIDDNDGHPPHYSYSCWDYKWNKNRDGVEVYTLTNQLTNTFIKDIVL